MNIYAKMTNIFDVPVVFATKRDIVLWCEERILTNVSTNIVTVNPEILLMARRDAWYKTILQKADLITPDGAGICWALRFTELADQSTSIVGIIKLFIGSLWQVVFGRTVNVGYPERVSGADLFWDIIQIAEQQNKKVYLIGGERKTAQRAAKRIISRYKKINIWAYGPDHTATPYSPQILHNEIIEIRPEIIFVAYGSPKQEEWINQNMHRYPFVRFAMGVGGTLDFIAGNAVRAPLRLQKHALEWFWRLYQRPSRIIRVFRATMVFPSIILISQLNKFYARKFRK
jgi:N-acetylglucosaminyldiphosphoundecaprenol N-acetyl-beta-D-mannosaminyltransferase